MRLKLWPASSGGICYLKDAGLVLVTHLLDAFYFYFILFYFIFFTRGGCGLICGLEAL